MLPDRVSYPGPLTYESGALTIALRGPAFPWELCYPRQDTAVCLVFTILQASRAQLLKASLAE